jgi:ankyrin repeat protein
MSWTQRIIVLLLWSVAFIGCENQDGIKDAKKPDASKAPSKKVGTYTDWNLLIAASTGDITKVQALLGKGAEVDVKDTDGTTPLIVAATNGNLEVAHILIDHGANVNARGTIIEIVNKGELRGGWTALIRAAANGHAEIVKLLLEKGADPNIREVMGESALMAAAQQNHADIVGILKKAGARTVNSDEELLIAAAVGDHNAVRLLVEEGAFVHAKTKTYSYPFRGGGFTPLMLAALNGHVETVKVLLAASANVNEENNGGKTATKLAREKGHTNIINLLREAGARK